MASYAVLVEEHARGISRRKGEQLQSDNRNRQREQYGSQRHRAEYEFRRAEQVQYTSHRMIAGTTMRRAACVLFVIASLSLGQGTERVDIELMTHAEIHDAIHKQGKTTVLIFNGGTEQR